MKNNNQEKISVEKKLSERQELLEKLFFAVDSLKASMSTTKSIEVKEHSIKCDKDFFELDKEKREFKLNGKVMISKVTDFYASLFEDSNSVLYRLEINGKEQVRGYIFLTARAEDLQNSNT